MILQVPTQPNFPWYRFSITLTGVVFVLVLRYNTRMARWILDINDSSGEPLVLGLPVLIDRNMNGQYVLQGLPSGFFFATDDVNGSMQQPTLNSFEVDHTLLYADET